MHTATMTTFGTVWLVVVILGFAVSGWLFIFKTSMLVKWGQTNRAKSRFIRFYPFTNIVQKPWYPTYNYQQQCADCHEKGTNASGMEINF